MPERAVWWPRASTLIVSDLHWGKAETFRVNGVPVPGGVVEHDLARLDRALDATGARRILVIGDLMHNPRGLTPEMVERIAAWRRARPVELVLVPGNHDRRVEGVREAWGVRVVEEEHREGAFRFAHDPSDEGPAEEGVYTWSGHLRPMARLSGGGDSVRLACFHLRPRVGVLPAFSVFTAGFTVRPRAGDRVFVVAEGRVVGV